MRIEFLKDHGVYTAGRVVDHPHPGVAEELVLRRIARKASVADVPVLSSVVAPAAAVPPASPKPPKRERRR